jgi:D-alanyl-D-alanine carboxypeptidase (penicillin-binding protein 5/6)
MVALVMPHDLRITMPRKSRRGMTAKVVFREPIPAPIEAGAPIARLVISAPGRKDLEVPLLAGADVKRLGFFGRMVAAVRYLLWGASG